jgi:hypothetical protein
MTGTFTRRAPLLFAALAVLAGCGGAPPAAEDQTLVLPPDPTEIAFFYASPAEVVRGESTTMCFSTQAADAVSIDPPIRELHPSISYCFNFEPQQTETYTLTATGEGGEDSAEITVQVVEQSSAPPEPTQVVIRTFSASSDAIVPGERTSICYLTNGARSVAITPTPPGELELERYCFVTAPSETTTYTLTAVDANGREHVAELTIEVLTDLAP